MATYDAFGEGVAANPYSTAAPDIPQTFPAFSGGGVANPYSTAAPDIPQTFPAFAFQDSSGGVALTHTMRAYDTDQLHYVFWQSGSVDATGNDYGGNPAALQDITVFDIKVCA